MHPFLRRLTGSTLGCALVLISGLAAASLGCANRERGDASIPEAALYRSAAQFSGTWTGYVEGNYGELVLERLSQGVYGGNFIGDEQSVQFALVAQQDQIRLHERGRARGSNRLIFKWQDGGTSSGRGWLLVSREGKALTGEFGFGEAAIGGGLWNFVRVEEGAAQ